MVNDVEAVLDIAVVAESIQDGGNRALTFSIIKLDYMWNS